MNARAMRWGWAAAAIVLLISVVSPVEAQTNLQPRPRQSGPEAMYGTWGTPAQCAAHRAGNTSDPRLLPYVINDEWIRHGPIYCYLTWREHFSSTRGTQAHALAQCGEDALRDYRVFLTLRDGALHIRWSEDFTTAALEVCGD